MKRRTEALLLVAVLILAAWLRARGLGWGLPYPYHPDEGSILFHSLAFGTGDLNPHWFRWPSLLMYFMFGVYGAYYVVGRLAGAFGAPVDLLRAYLTDLSPFWLMGRWVSVAAGVATVWVAQRIGRRAFGPAAGLTAALLLAVMYLHVRDSHYATPDVVTTLLASLSLLAALRACDTHRFSDLVLSGLFAGLAASVKYPGVLAGAGTLVAYFHLAASRRVSRWSLAAVAFAVVVGFVVGTPYSVLSFREFTRDVLTQFTMVSSSGVGQGPSSFGEGLAEVFGRTVARGIGYPILALALLGAFARGRRAGIQRGVIAAYAGAVVIVAVMITVKRSTYLTPALPAIAVLAAAGIDRIFRASAERASRWRRTAAVALAVAVAALAVVPSLRFDGALAAVDTRTLAKTWIEAEVAPGTRVATEDYGPVLNPLTSQLAASVDLDTTGVDSWRSPKRRLNELKLEVGERRSPEYELYGIGHGTPPFELPDAGEDPDGLEAALVDLGVEFVVLSSKAAPWRPMRGAEPPAVPGECRFLDWLASNASMVARFAPEQPVPPIDRGDGRSFHSPVIEIYRVRGPQVGTEGGDVAAHAGTDASGYSARLE